MNRIRKERYLVSKKKKGKIFEHLKHKVRYILECDLEFRTLL